MDDDSLEKTKQEQKLLYSKNQTTFLGTQQILHTHPPLLPTLMSAIRIQHQQCSRGLVIGLSHGPDGGRDLGGLDGRRANGIIRGVLVWFG